MTAGEGTRSRDRRTPPLNGSQVLCHAAVKEPARTKLCGFGVRCSLAGQQDRRVDHRPSCVANHRSRRRGDLAAVKDDGVSAALSGRPSRTEQPPRRQPRPRLGFPEYGKFPTTSRTGGCLRLASSNVMSWSRSASVSGFSRRVLGLQKAPDSTSVLAVRSESIRRERSRGRGISGSSWFAMKKRFQGFIRLSDGWNARARTWRCR